MPCGVLQYMEPWAKEPQETPRNDVLARATKYLPAIEDA